MPTISELSARIEPLTTILQIEQKRTRLTELRTISEASDFWSEQEQAVAVMAEISSTEKLLSDWDDLQILIELSTDANQEELTAIEEEVKNLERQALLSHRQDSANAVLTIHAGTGGVDAQDWAQILERMFLRYVEQGKTEEVQDRTLSFDRSSWSATILDRNQGEEAGVKSVTIEVKGRMAFGLLKGEAGVHRLVRLSPFNAKNLRQTSFALVEVIPEAEASKEAVIPESDLRIDVYRSGGAGGQHVNTTDSAVRITHLPTGIVVAIQNERSQVQNKATALKILQSKLARLQELKNAEEVARLKGEFKEGTWGNQIRSYVMQPYQMVKDHRTNYETANISAVLDGELAPFIESELIYLAEQ